MQVSATEYGKRNKTQISNSKNKNKKRAFSEYNSITSKIITGTIHTKVTVAPCLYHWGK